MNTLLPFSSFNSLGLLSNADLGIQIHEAAELVHLLEDCPVGWHKSKEAMQWFGHLEALKAYYNLCIVLWGQRGFTPNRKIYTNLDLRFSTKLPAWVGDERVHSFHRGILLKRRPDFYNRYGWKISETPIYPDMHTYGLALREHKIPEYQPMVEFDWNAFYKALPTG